MICNEKKLLALKLRDEGYSLNQISKKIKIPRSTIQYFLDPHPRKGTKATGRPKAIQAKQKKVIKSSIARLNKNEERITAKKILNQTKLNVSPNSIRRFMAERGMKYSVIKQKIILSDAEKSKRVQAVMQWINEGISFRKVIFTDEKKFNMDGPDCFSTWWGPDSIVHRNKRHMGGGSIMVHGAISSDGRFFVNIVNERITGVVYKELLETVFASFPSLKNDYILQHDGAPAHRCKLIKSFLTENGVQVLHWPPHSPDLNLIEYLWKSLSEMVYDRKTFSTKEDLKETVLKCSDMINLHRKDLIKSLYDSMASKIRDVLCNDGNIL